MTDDELRALYELPMSLRAIQRKTGIHYLAVRRAVLRAGGKMRARGSPAGRQDRTRAVEMRREGLTYAEIGRRLGVSRQRAWSMVSEAARYTGEAMKAP